MSTNKSISYLLCNKDIIVNLYKLHFLSSHFSFQPNKRVFYPPIFSSLQPNTHKEKLNIFHSPTFPLLQPNRPLGRGDNWAGWVINRLDTKLSI